MYFKTAISRRIYELCEKNKITPNKLSELSAIAPTTLNDVLNEKVDKPNSYIIFKICKTLKISLSDFYNSDLFNIDNIDE